MNAESSLSSYRKTDRVRGRRPSRTEFDANHKFMQTIGDEMFNELGRISREKGIRVQTLLRAVIIPAWIERQMLSRNPGQNPGEIQAAFRQKRK